MNADLDTLNEVLKKAGLTGLEAGAIETQMRTTDDPLEAMRAFKQFGGEGWLITAETKEPFIFPRATTPDGEWPVEGELAKNNVSLRLFRQGDDWALVLLTEGDGAGVIKTVEHLAHDPTLGKLVYRVCYSVVEGEFRATTYRFAAFSGKDTAHV